MEKDPTFKKLEFVEYPFLEINGKKAYCNITKFAVGDNHFKSLQYLIVGSKLKVYILTFVATPTVYEHNWKKVEKAAESAKTD